LVAAHQEITVWHADDEARVAGWIAKMIDDLNDSGVPYRDVGVLVRGRASYRWLVDTFATFDIPVQPGGRTGLFDQPEARVLGQTFAWMTGIDWRPVRGPGAAVDEDDLLDEYQQVFALDAAAGNRLRRLLREWRDAVPRKDRSADLVEELYLLLGELEVRTWDLSDRWRSTGSARWPASPHCWRTTSRCGAGPGPTRRRLESRSVARTG
jgi:DNA helicase-2/ATP-dependent DNA helicase PcrA